MRTNFYFVMVVIKVFIPIASNLNWIIFLMEIGIVMNVSIRLPISSIVWFVEKLKGKIWFLV